MPPQSAGAPAKINLFLHAGDRNAEGFHPLQSLAVFPALGDRLTAEAAGTFSLDVRGPFAASLSGELGPEAGNLVLKAARLLAERLGVAAGAKFTLVKNLPVAAGIGGGSADAAAALRLLPALWQLRPEEAMLREIAAQLGSDVPACLLSRACWMEGRGERLLPVAALPRLDILLVNPGVKLATRDVFAALQSRSGVGMNLPPQGFGDMADLLRFLDTSRNDLEAPARRLQPMIGEVLAAMAALPGALFSRMSGSGASCFALFPDAESRARAATLLAAAHPGWWVKSTLVAEFGIEHESAGRDFGPTPDGL